MKKKDYLKKKFEYYQHMKELRNEEHKYLMERLRLEITVLESRVRSKLGEELMEHILTDKFKHEIMADMKDDILVWIKEEYKKENEGKKSSKSSPS